MDTLIATNSLTLGRLLARHARYRPSHTAVVIGNQRLTYLQFNDFVNRWANALAALGVGRGDRVATILPNSLRTACDLLGLREAWRRCGAFVATPTRRGLHIVAE